MLSSHPVQLRRCPRCVQKYDKRIKRYNSDTKNLIPAARDSRTTQKQKESKSNENTRTVETTITVTNKSSYEFSFTPPPLRYCHCIAEPVRVYLLLRANVRREKHRG